MASPPRKRVAFESANGSPKASRRITDLTFDDSSDNDDIQAIQTVSRHRQQAAQQPSAPVSVLNDDVDQDKDDDNTNTANGHGNKSLVQVVINTSNSDHRHEFVEVPGENTLRKVLGMTSRNAKGGRYYTVRFDDNHSEKVSCRLLSISSAPSR
jgi:hypothetical protein